MQNSYKISTTALAFLFIPNALVLASLPLGRQGRRGCFLNPAFTVEAERTLSPLLQVSARCARARQPFSLAWFEWWCSSAEVCESPGKLLSCCAEIGKAT